MQQLWIYIIVLLRPIPINSISSISPLLPPTHQPCLLHFVLQKQVKTMTYYAEEEQLNSIILKGSKENSSDVFLVSYSNPKNSSIDDDSDAELETRPTPQSLEYSRFKWREGACFRFLVWNSKSVMDVIKETHLEFWKHSELPKILVFAPEYDNNASEESAWNWESISEMKESGNFNGFKAKVYFIQFRNRDWNINIYKVGFLCYMCPQQNSINWIGIETSLERKTLVNKNIVNVGYKRKLYLKGGPDLTNMEEDRNCELALFFQKTKECGMDTVFLQIVKTGLNLSVERVEDLGEVEFPLSTSILLLNDNPREMTSLGNGRSEYFLRFQTIGKLFYCTGIGSLEFEAISWDIFLRPVHPEIWVCIVAIGVVYSLITKDVYIGFRALMLLTGQSISGSLSRNKLILGPLFPLVIVSICYLTLITLDVIVPPVVSVIKENKQLLALGFKIIVPSLDLLPVIKRLANKSMEKYGIDWDEKHFVEKPDLVKSGEALQPEFLLALGAIRGVYHTHSELVIFMRRLKLLNPRSNRYGNVTCSVVEQDWDEINFDYLLSGYMSTNILTYAFRLLEMGFNVFWTTKKNVNAVSNMQLSRYCQDQPEACEGTDNDFKGMNLNSSIRIIFWFLLLFSAIAFISFGLEFFT